jgi:peptidoglycan/LPS O-acetylase OafA/YrhL
MKPDFNPQLESVRGLAALAVVATHSISVFQIDGSAAWWAIPFLEQTALQKIAALTAAVLNPSFAVILFFVLSGYVLALSLMRSADTPLSALLPRYLARRFFRLIPPMWTAILLCALVFNVAHNDGAFTDFFVQITQAPNAADIAKNILLIDFAANQVTWTMYIEIIGSMALPFLCLSSRRSVSAAAMTLIVLVFLTLAFRHVWAFRYLPCFQVGVILAMHPLLAQFTRPSLAFGCRLALSIIDRILSAHWTISLMIETFAAYLVLSAVLSSNYGAILNLRPVRHIGRVSYSLYLFHPAILGLVPRHRGLDSFRSA